MVVEGEDSWEDVMGVLRHHRLGGGLQHQADHLLDAADEEAVGGASYALPCEVLLQPLRPPPQEVQHLERHEHASPYDAQGQAPPP